KTLGNYWVIAYVDSHWVATTSEWIGAGDGIREGRACQGDNALTIGAGNRRLDGWRPATGELVGFMLSTPSRMGVRGPVAERSNIFWARWGS
ncbi:MAG TPA: hypothetical protein VM598_06910, partial [Bdellovibrionota bacterium]|nr:hypothetical protein [Bdellovibrionota bacterium]